MRSRGNRQLVITTARWRFSIAPLGLPGGSRQQKSPFNPFLRARGTSGSYHSIAAEGSVKSFCCRCTILR